MLLLLLLSLLWLFRGSLISNGKKAKRHNTKNTRKYNQRALHRNANDENEKKMLNSTALKVASKLKSLIAQQVISRDDPQYDTFANVILPACYTTWVTPSGIQSHKYRCPFADCYTLLSKEVYIVRHLREQHYDQLPSGVFGQNASIFCHLCGYGPFKRHENYKLHLNGLTHLKSLIRAGRATDEQIHKWNEINSAEQENKLIQDELYETQSCASSSSSSSSSSSDALNMTSDSEASQHSLLDAERQGDRPEQAAPNAQATSAHEPTAVAEAATVARAAATATAAAAAAATATAAAPAGAAAAAAAAPATAPPPPVKATTSIVPAKSTSDLKTQGSSRASHATKAEPCDESYSDDSLTHEGLEGVNAEDFFEAIAILEASARAEASVTKNVKRISNVQLDRSLEEEMRTPRAKTSNPKGQQHANQNAEPADGECNKRMRQSTSVFFD